MRTILAVLALLTATTATAQPMLSQPALSPDGKSIAFVSGDDIWIAPAGGGEAHILIANELIAVINAKYGTSLKPVQ